MSKHKPLHVAWDSTTSGSAIQAVNEGVNTILSFVPAPVEIAVLGTGPWSQGEFGETEWYLDSSTLPDGRIDATEVVSLLEAEPWRQDPHLDLVATGRPLTGPDENGAWLNFVFGFARGDSTIISFDRFVEDASSPEMAYKAFRVIVAHELGHAFGIHLPPGEKNADPRPDIYRGHCVNTCVMRQVASVREAEMLALDIELMATSILCPDCQDFLRKII